MIPYIKFNDIRSDALGLRLVSAEPFILPKRTRQREYIPGRLGSISSADFEMPAAGYRIRLAAMGTDKSAVINKMHSIASWALSARMMTVWHEPGYYYTGAVEGDSSFSMLSRRNGMIEIEFICDPPCRQRASIPAGMWFPELDKPIPEQLSDMASTDYAKAKTTAFTLRSAGLDNTLPPALHLALTGTWSSLQIGASFVIAGPSATMLPLADKIVVAANEHGFLVADVMNIVEWLAGDYALVWENSTTHALKRLLALTNVEGQMTPTWQDITAEELVNERTLYIDCDAQEVYRLVSGTRTPVKYSGDFPTLNEDGELGITGTGFNLSTAYLLVIERG